MTQHAEKQIPVEEQKLQKEVNQLQGELRQTRARLHSLNKLNGVLIHHNLDEAVAHSDNERSLMDQHNTISNLLGDSQITNNQLNNQIKSLNAVASLRDLVSLATVQGIEAIRENDVTDLKHITRIHDAILTINKCTNETIKPNFDAFQTMLAEMFAPVAESKPAANAKIELKKNESEGSAE